MIGRAEPTISPDRNVLFWQYKDSSWYLVVGTVVYGCSSCNPTQLLQRNIERRAIAKFTNGKPASFEFDLEVAEERNDDKRVRIEHVSMVYAHLFSVYGMQLPQLMVDEKKSTPGA